MRRFLAAHPEFLKLWAGQGISSFGSAITLVAMPLAAVVVLHSSPVQMGVLSALSVLPHLLFSLPAGVWVDRLPRRTLLVVADVGRALLLGSIPIAWALGLLRIEHLYVVAFLAGVLTMLFDTSAMTFLPALVGRDDLVEANSAWALNGSVAATAGPSAAGALVQLLSAPLAIAVDAVSFVGSAACSLLVRVPPDSTAARRRGPVRLRAEIAEGVRALVASPVLSAVTVSATVGALAGAMRAPLLVLYLVRELHLSPAAVGLAVTASGLAAVAGTLVAPAFCRRLGTGRVYITGGLLTALAGFALAAARSPLALLVPFLLAGQLLGGLGPPLFGIPQRSLRQSLVPDQVLGRVNASWRFLVFGVQPLGALAGGVLGARLGLRPTLVVSSMGILAGVAWAVRSPLRSA